MNALVTAVCAAGLLACAAALWVLTRGTPDNVVPIRPYMGLDGIGVLDEEDGPC